ncbi:hypothetical protein D7270_00390 [Legionella pneumophila]|nr:hypothetical protein A9E97_11015 [Legionella pneumophila]PNL77404.1 hypothetical protein A6J41_005565 [Legionella pneumophila subsp. pneumophila]AOU08218.1 hypothetical protein A9E98_11315 [Legionella pneumophila]AOU11214.1 hypothetical protein A9F03_11440 [Legionella pneumophila]AOU14094.1 hypothetical protein A9E99_11260 [Legionella pneumophila]
MGCFYTIVLKLSRYKVYFFHLAHFLMTVQIQSKMIWTYPIIMMHQANLKQSILQFYFSKSLQIVVIIVKIEKIYQY